jgi:phage FluMu gp28-like protein
MNIEQTAGATQTAISREPDHLSDEFTRGSEIPETLDPLTEGILMKHQADWLADKSDLKLAEKGRRTGITFAEALDDTLIAASSRAAGGDNIFYIGDTKDKGREFIGYVAHFARIVAKELLAIEEFIFEDVKADGSSQMISAFRVRFGSGFRIEALSSRPENIRGLQGIVVIDEAAYHKDVRGVLDAVNALLIWGGKIRVISTHNGVLSAFNELIREARAGKNPFSVHFIPFGDAVKNGLYKRVCLIKGKVWSQEAETEWEGKIRASYGPRTAQMQQELDAIPSDAEGAALTRVQIENIMQAGIPVLRLDKPDTFKNANQDIRKADIRDWCEKHLRPVLEKLDPSLRHVFGEDFARSGDATAIMVFAVGRDLVRRCVLVVELHNIPFEQQRDILFYVVDRLPRLQAGALDAGGNGAYLAEVAAQRYGSKIFEVKFSQEWYRLEMPPFIAAFGDGSIVLARDEDILRDHQALQFVGGYIKVPDGFTYKGANGLGRHGDTAIASALAWYASRQDTPVHDGYMSSRELEREPGSRGFEDDDNFRRHGGLW